MVLHTNFNIDHEEIAYVEGNDDDQNKQHGVESQLPVE